MPWSPIVPDRRMASPGATRDDDSATPEARVPMPEVLMKMRSALPRPTTLVSPVTITATEGVVSSKGDHVYFQDNVRVTRAAYAENSELVMRTAFLHIVPYQHLAMTVFRAVENHRYLVRAANTGITAVVDPHGRVLERTELFERAVLVRDVPLLAGSTFYTRHGDVFAWACLGAAVALTAAGLKKRSHPPGLGR